MNPRAELRDMLKRIMGATVPHLKLPDQLKYLAKRISAESGLDVGAGTIKDWLYALDDDARRVDSRHMDWARARSRTMSANDNRIMAGGPRAGDYPPCSSLTWRVAA